MAFQISRRVAFVLVASVAVLAGCDGGNGSGTGSGGAPPVAEAGYFTGRVTLAGGAPVTLPGVKYTVSVNGVTAVGERNNFSPMVGTDGTFKMKLPQGIFYPPYGTVTFPFEGKNYVAPLAPVDPVEGTRDGAPGILANFEWRLKGAKSGVLNPDPNNATHWYGITIPVGFAGYREDTKEPQKTPADGTKLVWTLKPVSKQIDGGEAKVVTVEQTCKPVGGSLFSEPLHDIVPANYEVSGMATLPDGTTKRLLLRIPSEGAVAFTPTVTVNLLPYPNTGEVVLNALSWVVE